ncbi:MAG TPA: hypothetical protein VFD90_19615 [Gaiellales bacterium]|nr:hypothetical protein [Gaiellales bacterium]
MDDGPVAPAAVHSLSGPALDAACRAVAALGPHAAIAGPAWWDANAPERRVTYVWRATHPLPPPPWSPRRALDFCAELALALATVHEAGAAQGALGPGTVAMRPDGGPLVRAPHGTATAAGDLHGLGVLLLFLLTARREGSSLELAGEAGPAADTAELLERLLSADPAARPSSAREVGASLAEIASAVPETAVAAADSPEHPRRRRARLVTALVLLVIAGAAGGYLIGHRVGPPGPALSPTTVTVPPEPGISP